MEETNGGEDYRNIVAGQLLRESDERYHPYKHHIGNGDIIIIASKITDLGQNFLLRSVIASSMI